jgi:hypothetical protein
MTTEATTKPEKKISQLDPLWHFFIDAKTSPQLKKTHSWQ